MKDDNFSQLLSEKKRISLNEDFDMNMMLLIKKYALNKSKEKKYIRLMYIFFFIGLVLGITLALTFVDFELFIGNRTIPVDRIILTIPLVVILLFLFEKIYKATLVKIGKEEFTS